MTLFKSVISFLLSCVGRKPDRGSLLDRVKRFVFKKGLCGSPPHPSMICPLTHKGDMMYTVLVDRHVTRVQERMSQLPQAVRDEVVAPARVPGVSHASLQCADAEEVQQSPTEYNALRKGVQGIP